MNVKIAARTDRTKGLVITRLGKRRDSHTAGTVVMKNVRFGNKVFGEMLEESDRKILPRSTDMMAVSNWPTAKYVARLGGYVDSVTGRPLTSASAVYMVGTRIYYM